MPKLLADGREFSISGAAWEAWKQAAEPFELPDDVLRRVLQVAPRVGAPEPLSADPDVTAGSSDAQASRAPRARRASGRTQKPGGKRTRVASDLILPEGEYEIPILRALAASDGRRATREVVEAVGRELDDRLTVVDREPMNDGGPPRWQNRVQFARLRMVRAGLMNKDSPRGVWEISPAGEQRLAEATS